MAQRLYERTPSVEYRVIANYGVQRCASVLRCVLVASAFNTRQVGWSWLHQSLRRPIVHAKFSTTFWFGGAPDGQSSSLSWIFGIIQNTMDWTEGHFLPASIQLFEWNCWKNARLHLS